MSHRPQPTRRPARPHRPSLPPEQQERALAVVRGTVRAYTAHGEPGPLAALARRQVTRNLLVVLAKMPREEGLRALSAIGAALIDDAQAKAAVLSAAERGWAARANAQTAWQIERAATKEGFNSVPLSIIDAGLLASRV